MPTPATRTEDALWFRRFDPAPGGRIRLICFPHAGGAASHYVPFARALAPDVAALVVQYPGRQDRRREPFAADLPALADAVTDALGELTREPLAFFGHSMGAIVAFEVAQRLRDRALPGPLRLFASGRRSPTTPRTETVHLRDDPGLVAELSRLGGSDARTLRDPDILGMVLPTARSDYKAIETYEYRSRPPLDCPITVLSGTTDTHTTRAELDAWGDHSAAAVDFHSFDGGHFFVDTCRDQVVTVVKAAMTADEAALAAA
jgi:surfactin synthase thioesterase subunit